ncbi:MAG TPA: FecR family protein [Allosphingosinicella sp.]|jgi:hypothetical protein
MHARALIAFLLLIWSPAAFAQTAPWRVTEATGQVQVQRGSQLIAARRGAAIAPGEMVSTGANGRAVLVRGRDFVIVSPRTRLRVPGTSEQGGNIRMIQAAGRAQYRIERRAAPHFAVRTPHLVALVKGTVFTVTVGEEGATVAVSEGRVEVATLAGEMRQMVEPGFAASVSAADPARLSHGRSDDAQAAHEPRRSQTARAASTGSDARGREDGDRQDSGNGRGQARLEYGDLSNIPGGNGGGNGHELNRVRAAERSVADALAHATNGSNNDNPGGPGSGNGPGPGAGAGGGPGSGGGSVPAADPVADPAAPSTPAPPSTSPPSGSGSSGSGGSNSGPGSSNSGPGSSSSGSGSSGSGSSGSESSGSGSSGSSGPGSGSTSAPLDPTISLPTAPATTVVVAVPPVDASEIVPLPGEPSAPAPSGAPPSSTLDPTISLPTAQETTVVVATPSLDPSAIVPLPSEPAPAPSEPAPPPPPPAAESVPPPTVTAPTEPAAPPPPPPSAPTNTQNRCLLGLICL